MNEKDQSMLEKFEIDKETSELKIVEIPESQYKSEQEKLNKKNKVKEVEEPKKSIGKQLVMNQLLGFDMEKTTDKKQRVFKTLVSVIFIIFVVGVLCWTAFNDFSGGELPPFSQMLNTFSQNWYYLLFALLAIFLMYFFKGSKLSVMCKFLTGKWHFRTCFETGIVGIYYNNITPLAVGGQPFEIHYLSKHGVHGGVASSLPIAGFFLNQFAFVILGMISVILFATNALSIPVEMIGVIPNITSILAIIGLVCCLVVPLLVVIFCLTPRVGSAMVNFVAFLGTKLKLLKKPEEFKFKTKKTVFHNAKCLKKITANGSCFIATFLLSFCEQFAYCSIAYFSLKFFGFNWPAVHVFEWLQVIQLCLILYAAISFIPTPGNSGAADLSFYLLFKTGLGISGSSKYGGFAFPSMLLWRFLSFYSTIILGFIFNTAKRKSDVRKEKNQNNS